MTDSQHKTDIDFPSRLRARMVEKGLSQATLANLCGVSQAAVSGWVGGAIPHKKKLQTLSRVLEVNPHWLVEGAEPKVLLPGEEWPDSKKDTPEVLFDKIVSEGQRTFPERIRFLRKHLGLTLAEFARGVGYAPSYISRLEAAERVNPSWKFVEALRGKFRVDQTWLYFGVGTPFPSGKTDNAVEQTANKLWAQKVFLEWYKTTARFLRTDALHEFIGVLLRGELDLDPEQIKGMVKVLNAVVEERLSAGPERLAYHQKEGLTLDEYMRIMHALEEYEGKNRPANPSSQERLQPSLAKSRVRIRRLPAKSQS